MAIWEDFEARCAEYLNNEFGEFACFELQGGANSTVADILVKTESNKTFYMESKCSPAQCGQFVLLPNIQTNSFEYSKLNATQINSYSKRIIDHMNLYFEEYRNSGTAGKEIIFENCSEVFSKWIVSYYREKGVKFFITNNYVILPIDDFSQYFDVKAKYRIKRSGSSSVGKSLAAYFSKVFVNNDIHNYKIFDIRIDGTKLFVKSDLELHNKRFTYGEYEFMFAKRGLEYELRKLSNTYNANVIFSINIIENQRGLNNSDFALLLK